VNVRNTIFSDVEQCVPIEVKQSFRGITGFHQQGEKIRGSKLRKQPTRHRQQTVSKTSKACFLGLPFDSEDGGSTFPRNVLFTKYGSV
jgi:hypothetical protein